MKVVEMRTVLAAAVLMAVAGTAGAAQPQSGLVPTGAVESLTPGPTDWGTTTNIILTIDASDLELFSGASNNGVDGSSAARFCTGAATCGWLGGVQLMSGARIISIELDACDTDAANEVSVALFKSPKGGAVVTSLVPFAGTGVAAVPGCTTFSTNLATPETVNNLTTNYLVDVLSGPNNTTKWRAIRIIYRLQVSAAPATATFPNDVPTTHPFFRFVEAMAASGLTGGCGAGSFCPDQAVTRGQLSVFLSSALGLHFPN